MKKILPQIAFDFITGEDQSPASPPSLEVNDSTVEETPGQSTDPEKNTDPGLNIFHAAGVGVRLKSLKKEAPVPETIVPAPAAIVPALSPEPLVQEVIEQEVREQEIRKPKIIEQEVIELPAEEVQTTPDQVARDVQEPGLPMEAVPSSEVTSSAEVALTSGATPLTEVTLPAETVLPVEAVLSDEVILPTEVIIPAEAILPTEVIPRAQAPEEPAVVQQNRAEIQENHTEIQENRTEVQETPTATANKPAVKSARGRKSLKQTSAEADLIEIPGDDVLFSKQYYTMGEVAEMFRVNQSLLRFWEAEFDVLKPRKNKKGDRYFRPVDIKNLHLIYHLLRQRKYTIEGAKDFLKKNKKAEERFEAIQNLHQIKAFLLEWKAQL